MVGQILAKLDFLDEVIANLSAEIDRMIAPFEPQVALLVTIPGIERRSAQELIAEIGVDMTRFPTAGHLASWAGMCPGHHESAGKRRSGQTRPGSKWLHRTLREAAKAAGRTKNTYLGAQYARLADGAGRPKPPPPSGTPSSSPPTTCSATASPTTNSGPTGSTGSAPTNTPDDSPARSKRSASPSPSHRRLTPQPTNGRARGEFHVRTSRSIRSSAFSRSSRRT